MILSSENYIYKGHPMWDPKLEGMPFDRVPAKILRHIARKYAEFSDGTGAMGTFPTTSSANDLRALLIFCLNQLSKLPRKTQARIAASMLMGLAEEGDFTA